MPDFNSTNWLCLQTTAKREITLAGRLLALDVPAYCPRYQTPLGDRGAWITLALFPSYLFCDAVAYQSNLHFIRTMPVHLRQSVVGKVSANMLGEIRAREDANGFVPVEGIRKKAEFAKGDYVEIKTGVMTGFRGYLSRDPTERIAWLYGQMLGGQREIAVDVSNLRLAPVF